LSFKILIGLNTNEIGHLQILQFEKHAQFDEMSLIGDESRQIRRYCVFVRATPTAERAMDPLSTVGTKVVVGHGSRGDHDGLLSLMVLLMLLLLHLHHVHTR
jgi:hypothetical protein